jgi:hypothetical protein
VVTDLPFSAGSFISATATDPDGNTSEFGPSVSAASTNPILPQASDDLVHRIQGRILRIEISTLLANDSAGNTSPLTLLNVSPTSSAGATVTLADPFVIYEPNSEDILHDTFTYTISNGEATARATVTISVVSLKLGIAQLGQNGQLTFTFSGIPTRRYQLQFSTNLTPPILWLNAGDAISAPITGSFNISDSPGSSVVFYRVIEIP